MSRFQFSLICICCTALLMLTNVSDASIVDGDFEGPNSSTVWTSFGTTFFDTTSPMIVGQESVRLEGNGDPNAINSGVFQDIPLGTNINTGFLVRLSGILGHTSSDPLTGNNRAFLEVSFVDAANNVIIGSSFQSAGITASSTTDVYHNNMTAVGIVPSNAVAVRVQAVFQELTIEDGVNSGAAFVDNLDLTVTVPEPHTALLLATGLLAVFSRRRRSVL